MDGDVQEVESASNMTDGEPFRSGVDGGETKDCAERLVQQGHAADAMTRAVHAWRCDDFRCQELA